MRFNLERPDMRKALAGTQQDIERAVTSGMRDAADGLKQDLRDDVVASGLGERLSRTWRGKVFPEVGESVEAAAFVWSKAPKLINAFDRGVTIRSARGFWLAIPTPAAGARGRGPNGRASRITPAVGSAAPACGYASSIASAALRCWSPIRPDSTREDWRQRTGARPVIPQ